MLRLSAITMSAGLVLLGGCAAGYSPEAERVREAHENEVTDCEQIGEVYGSSSGFHWSSGEAMHNARNKALERAHELNASHVVWQHTESSITPEVQGMAYRCQSQENGD